MEKQYLFINIQSCSGQKTSIKKKKNFTCVINLSFVLVHSKMPPFFKLTVENLKKNAEFQNSVTFENTYVPV